MDLLAKEKIEVFHFPYYLQLTEDVARHYFQSNFGVFSKEKYKRVLNEVFGVDNECDLLAPGWHTTTNTPASFVQKGLERFLLEVRELPISVKSQLVHCLTLYMKRSNGKPDLIVPVGHANFEKFMNYRVKDEHINYFYCGDV